MRAKAEYPTRHADQHDPDGSDPLSGKYIKYDFQNVGNWLWIQASTSSDATYAIVLQTVGSDTFASIQLDSSQSIYLSSAVETRIEAATNLDLQGTEGVTVGSASGEIDVNPGTNLVVSLLVGGKLRVRDHLGNAIFEVREDATIHIKTGQTIVADL